MRAISLICIFYMSEFKNYIHTWVRTLKTVMGMCSYCTHADKCFHLCLILKIPIDSWNLSVHSLWLCILVLPKLGRRLCSRTTFNVGQSPCVRISISCNFLLNNIPLQCLVFYGDLASLIQQNWYVFIGMCNERANKVIEKICVEFETNL